MKKNLILVVGLILVLSVIVSVSALPSWMTGKATGADSANIKVDKGETQTFSLGEETHEISILFMNDASVVVLSVDGANTGGLNKGSTYESGNLKVKVLTIRYSNNWFSKGKYVTLEVSEIEKMSVYTDKTKYNTGDELKVYTKLPAFMDCEQYWISPSGEEIVSGFGGCAKDGMSFSEIIGTGLGLINQDGIWKAKIIAWYPNDNLSRFTLLSEPFEITTTSGGSGGGGGGTTPTTTEVTYQGVLDMLNKLTLKSELSPEENLDNTCNNICNDVGKTCILYQSFIEREVDTITNILPCNTNFRMMYDEAQGNYKDYEAHCLCTTP